MSEEDLPKVADLYDSPGLWPVPGVLVDEEEDDLLQAYWHLAENIAHVLRQLKLCACTEITHAKTVYTICEREKEHQIMEMHYCIGLV